MSKYKNRFITIEKLRGELQKKDVEFCLFGVSEDNKVILDNFEYEKLNVDFIVDNDERRQGTFLNNIPIISPLELKRKKSPLVVIVNSYYAEVYDQLEEIGIEDVYEVIDIKALCTKEMLKNDEILKSQFSGSTSEDIFVYVADGFGDNIIKYPILEKLSKESNCNNYYFLVDRQSNYDIYSSLFRNVFIYDSKRFYLDRSYRDQLLIRINSHRFKLGLCFCSTAYFHNHYDPFGKYNTNIPQFKSFFEYMDWENGKNYQFVSKDMQKMARAFFGYDEFCLSGENGLRDVIKKTKIIQISGKYVAFGMGGVSWRHVYAPAKIVEVMNWLIEKGFFIVLLGYGQDDDIYYKEVEWRCTNNKKIVNLSSKCNAFESIKVIESAEIYVGLDSALAHGACALNKKTIVLMSGNLFSKKFMHVGDKNVLYLNHKMECDGCDQCIYGKYNNRENDRGLCIQKIAPNDIKNAILQMLEIKT